MSEGIRTVLLPNAESFPVAAEAWAKDVSLLNEAGEPIAPENIPPENIPYGGQTIKDVLDKITYERLSIDTLITTPSVVEFGASTDITVSWTLTGEPTNQTVNTNVVANNLRSRVFTAVSVQTTFELVAQDSVDPNGVVSLNASITTPFRKRRFWGSSVNPVTTSADVIALGNSELSPTKQKSLTITTTDPGGEYIYYVYPEEMGLPDSFKLLGFEDDYEEITIAVTTPTGAIVNYTRLRSENKLIGGINVEVV